LNKSHDAQVRDGPFSKNARRGAPPANSTEAPRSREIGRE